MGEAIYTRNTQGGDAPADGQHIWDLSNDFCSVITDVNELPDLKSISGVFFALEDSSTFSMSCSRCSGLWGNRGTPFQIFQEQNVRHVRS